jgi:hypothetical protein
VILRIAIFLLAAVGIHAQTVNQATSLTNLLTRTPVVGGLYLVNGYYVSGDTGGQRSARHVPGSTATTNAANVFAFGSGRLIFDDRTNSVQNLRWWGGSPDAADNTAALTNCAAWVASLGGGHVYIPTGTYPLLYGGLTMPSGVRLRGDGPNATTLNFTAATPTYDYEAVLSWVGTVHSTVRLHSAPTVGDRTIVLASAVDWAWDEWIQISDTNAFSFGSRNYYKQGEFNYVYSNSGGTNIALMEPLEAAYPTATTTINRITPTVGSAEGIHFALGTKSGPVELRYADYRSYFRNCSAAGSEYAHFWTDSSHAVSWDGLSVEWDSDPSVGLNYGGGFGDSEHLLIRNCVFRTARHGIVSGGSTMPTRYCRVINSTFGSTRQNIAGADMHGDVVESTFDACTFLSGVTLGGGRNRLLNSTILNGRGATAISVGECYYYDWEVRGNKIKVTSFDDEAQSVWAMRFSLEAGSQSSQPASTNYWPGTWGGTRSQTIKILDNEIEMVGTRTNGNYIIFVDEASTLTANESLTPADFGGLIVRGNRITQAASQAFASITAPGIYVQTQDKVRFRVVDISDNPLIQGAGVQVRVHAGKVTVSNNTFEDLNTREGVYVIPRGGYALVGAVDVEVAENLFLRPIGSALTVSGTTGRLSARNNRIYDHGSINDSLSRWAIVTSDGDSSILSVDLEDNLIVSTNSPSYDVYVSTAAGTLRDIGTIIGGSVTAGTRSAGGGYQRVPYSLASFGATNAITMIGQYTALPTASSYPPGLAHSAGDLWYSDGSTWQAVQRATTNFHNLRATNGLVGKDLIAETATIGADWPGTKTAVDGILPLFVGRDTNDFVSAQVYNPNTGSDAAAVWYASAAGAQGRFLATSTNNSSANAKARVGVYAVTGAGLQFDLAYPASQDVVWTYGGGTEFARLSTNTLAAPSVTSTFATNIGTHFVTTTGTGARLAGSMTAANAKNAMAITGADITDSTSAGRALLTAANAAAQRSSLGLGTTSTLDDAPSDGYGYVRSNASWARQSGGGGGGSFDGMKFGNGTNDMVTITNAIIRGDGENIVQVEMSTGTEPVAQFTASIKPSSITTNKVNSAFLSFISSHAKAFTNSVTLGGVTNSAATNIVWAITLPALANDGDVALWTSHGALWNASGSSVNWDPMIRVNGGQKLRVQWSVGSSGYKRAASIVGGIRRLSSTTAYIWSDLNQSGTTITTNNGFGGTASYVRQSEYPVTATDWGHETNTVDFCSVFGTASTNIWLQMFGVQGERK